MVSELRVGLGTAPLGSIETGPLWWGPQDRDVAVATVRAAADAGVGFVDTAPSYGWGRAEEIVRDGLHGVAAPPPVFTKCGTHRGDDGRPYEDTSAAAIRRDVERSRERLGVDRIDVVQVHDPDPDTPIEETWETLMALRDEGVIAAAGISNHPIETMERALAVGPVAVVQQQYSLLYREPERHGVIDWCADHGIPFLAWSPLASGFLADGFDLAPLHPDDLRRRLRWATTDREWTAAVTAAQRDVAARHGATASAVAIAWVTRRAGVRAIVGARTPAEAEALGGPLPDLDDADRQRLDAPATAP